MSNELSAGATALDDGEPPSPRGVYNENYQTGEIYDSQMSERMRVQSLVHVANAILQEYGYRADEKAQARYGAAHLLRTPIAHGADLTVPFTQLADSPEQATRYSYSFWTNESNCRSWTDESWHVSWCAAEQRYEPPEEVEERLRREFNFTEQPAPELLSMDIRNRLRRVGGWLTARLGRRPAID